MTYVCIQFWEKAPSGCPQRGARDCVVGTADEADYGAMGNPAVSEPDTYTLMLLDDKCLITSWYECLGKDC